MYCLLLQQKGILKNKHGTDVNENMILVLVYRDGCVNLKVRLDYLIFPQTYLLRHVQLDKSCLGRHVECRARQM